MPQERPKSVVYRSFVTCENPRGVVEGKTIRINKTCLPTKMSSRKPEKETQTQLKISKEKEKMSLVEVKNGAQNLNEAIDSWSKGVGFRSQQKDIAKDLLKGALDLQESLRMLGKLQETSFVTNLKKKEKPSEEDFDRIGSDRFESFRSYDTGFEKERKLANGSSRDCYAELRDVIREGLSKQNLLPNKSYQESAFASKDSEGFAGKKKLQLQLQLSPDIASTSSSRSSSMVYSTHDFTSSDSFSSRATEGNSKGSNLIAKLMGLEEFPSKPPPSSPRKKLDIDLLNATKPQFFIQKMDREHMTLDEIIEIMQSKGFLTSNKQTSRRFINDTPPVVLMRPQRLGPENHKVKDFKVSENPIRKLHQEKAKTEDKVVKNRGRSKSPSKNEKASVPVVEKPKRKQETEKKVEKTQKTAPTIKRKPIEKVKSSNSVLKNASSKPQISALSNTVSKRISSSVSSTNKSSNQKKNTGILKPVIIKEALLIDLPNQEKIQESESPIKETDNVRQQSLSETTKNHDESSVSDKSERKVGILKSLNIFQDSEPNNFKLFQDCVKEFLEQENQRQNPLLPSRICISEDHMIREVVKKVENVRNFSKFSKESSNADTVSGLLERDLYLHTIGGAWSTTGWKDGHTVNEVEEVVLDLEKIVLSKLIDDIVMELVPY